MEPNTSAYYYYPASCQQQSTHQQYQYSPTNYYFNNTNSYNYYNYQSNMCQSYASTASSPSTSSPSSVSTTSSAYISPTISYNQQSYASLPPIDFNSPTPKYQYTSPSSAVASTPNQIYPLSANTEDGSFLTDTASSDEVKAEKDSKRRPRVAKLNLSGVNQKYKVQTATSSAFKCNLCPQSFVSAAKLFMHQHKYHKNGSSLQCPICFKKFNSQANALVHLRAHTQEKSYTCHICPQAFCDSSTLKKHIRTHTGEKPYECHLCDKKFTQSGNLKRHLTVHEKYDVIQAKHLVPKQTGEIQTKEEYPQSQEFATTYNTYEDQPFTYDSYNNNYNNYYNY